MQVYKTKMFKGKRQKGDKLEVVEFNYYSPDEADEQGIEYYVRPYPAHLRKGDHVLTDDAVVVPVLRVSSNSYARCREMKIPSGTFLLAQNHDILSTGPNRKRRFDPTDRKPSHYTKSLFAAMMVITNFNVVKAFQTAYQRKLESSNDKALVKNLLKDSEVLDKIMTRMEKLYSKAGIKPESIIERVNRVLSALTEKVEQSEGADDAIKLSQEVVSVAGVMGDWAGFETGSQDVVAMGGMMLTTTANPKLLNESKEVEQSESESIFDEDVK